MPRVILSILDVGHGNSTVLTDTQGVVVIDAGPGSSLLEFLAQEGIREIEVLLISHADKDHIEGIISVLESNTVQVHAVQLNTDSQKRSKLWDDLTYQLNQEAQIANVHFEVGLTSQDTGRFDRGLVHIEVLAKPVLGRKRSREQGPKETTFNYTFGERCHSVVDK